MAGITGQTQIDDAITSYVAEVRFTMENEGVMAPLIDTQRLPKKRGRTYKEPWIGTITAASLVDGVEFNSPTPITDNALTITPAEVGVQVLWTHRMADTIDFNFPEVAGRLMGNSINYNIDSVLLTLLDGFGGSVGGGTNPLTAGLVSIAASFARTGIPGSGGTARTGARTVGDNTIDPLPGMISLVAHEFNRHDLFGQLVGVGGTSVMTGVVAGNFPATAGITEYQRRLLADVYQGDIAGVGCYFTANLARTSNVVKGGVFKKLSLIHVKFREMIDKRVETDDGRATKHTLVVDYGSGERSDTGGIELNLDATAPALT